MNNHNLESYEFIFDALAAVLATKHPEKFLNDRRLQFIIENLHRLLIHRESKHAIMNNPKHRQIVEKFHQYMADDLVKTLRHHAQTRSKQ